LAFAAVVSIIGRNVSRLNPLSHLYESRWLKTRSDKHRRTSTHFPASDNDGEARATTPSKGKPRDTTLHSTPPSSFHFSTCVAIYLTASVCFPTSVPDKSSSSVSLPPLSARHAMSVLLTPTPFRQSHPQAQQAAMTIAYPDHNSSYGLITPPSEMRTTDDASMDANILAPPSGSRYYLRKQPISQALYPGNYQNTNYNSLVQARRRSVSSSTSATTASGATTTLQSTAAPLSPPLDLSSRDFNVGEFTATVLSLIMY
jgi:hypothetical protein